MKSPTRARTRKPTRAAEPEMVSPPTVGRASRAGSAKRRGATIAMGRLAPFLKWAGGKRSLLPELLRYVPAKIDTYYEPFLGGGALFFSLVGGEWGSRRFRRAVLADANAELISCYATIRSDVRAVIEALGEHRDGEEYFYTVRAQDPDRLSVVARAARTIYLNRNGYNGLFRVNRSGKFNVPFGKYSKLRTVRAERLRAVSQVLQEVSLRVNDFAECLSAIGPADFAYFDPPYVPLSPTSNFTSYSDGGFGEAHQRRLSELLRRLGREKIRALLSNSDCETTRALYRGLQVESIAASRAINSVGSRRGPVSELLVRSFRYPC